MAWCCAPGRRGATAPHRAGGGADVAVEPHDVPGAEVVAVVELAAVPRRGAEIVPVAELVRRLVLVVTDRGTGARLVSAPGGIVTLGVVGVRAVGIGVVARREYRARNAIEQLCGRVVTGTAAVGDVAGTDQYHGGGRRRRGRWRRWRRRRRGGRPWRR